jgi:hypothetical protein
MTLTTALALLGGVVLLALALHGLWQMRRAAARRPRVAPGAGPRQEPSLSGDEPAAPAAEAVPAAVVRAAPWRGARLDPLIDAIAPIALQAPVSGDAVVAHLPPSRRAGTKPFHVEGLDAETGSWEPIAPGRRYTELQAGVQLANRGGPLNEIEYSEFVHKVQALADSVDGRVDAPDMLEVAARARELDALASPLDATLVITLRSNSVAWSVGYLQQVAARHGFVPGATPGRFVLASAEEGAPALVVLSVPAQAALAEDPSLAAVRECTLALDVPQSPESAEPFPAFHRAATALAAELDAAPTDDGGQPVTLHAYDAIGREVQRLYRELDKLDLAAGSPAARRLFS